MSGPYSPQARQESEIKVKIAREGKTEAERAKLLQKYKDLAPGLNMAEVEEFYRSEHDPPQTHISPDYSPPPRTITTKEGSKELVGRYTDEERAAYQKHLIEQERAKETDKRVKEVTGRLNVGGRSAKDLEKAGYKIVSYDPDTGTTLVKGKQGTERIRNPSYRAVKPKKKVDPLPERKETPPPRKEYGGGTIEKADKPMSMTAKAESKAYELQTKGQGTGATTALTFIGVAKGAGKGFIKGVTAPFRPSFYTEEIPAMGKFVFGIFTGKTHLYHVGKAAMQEPHKVPGVMAELGGYSKGFGYTTSKVIAPAARAALKPKKSQMVTVNFDPTKISAKELKQLDKLAVKRTPQDIAMMENYLGKGSMDNARMIDINRLKPKQTKFLKEMIKKEKVSSEFELSTGKKPDGIVAGSSYKNPWTIAKEKGGKEFNKMVARMEARDSALGKRAAFLMTKAKVKARAAYERRTAKSQDVEIAREKYIREQMKETKQPAEKIIAEEKATQKLEEFKDRWTKEQKAYKERTGEDFKGESTNVREFEDLGKGYKDMGKRSQLGRALGPQRQQYVVLDEPMPVPKKSPIHSVTLASPKKILAMKNIVETSKLSKMAMFTGQHVQTQLDVSMQSTGQSQVYNTAQLQKVNAKQSQISTQAQLQIQSQDQIQAQKQSQSQASQQVQAQKLGQAQKTQQLQKQAQVTKQKITTEPPPPIVLKGMFADLEKKKRLGPYSVEIRRRGQFKKVSQAETLKEAFVKGKYAVGTTAAASFKIKGPGDIEGTARRMLPKKTFTRSKKDSMIFVERREKRIKSPGEKREITMKGIAATKIRGKKKKLWGL